MNDDSKELTCIVVNIVLLIRQDHECKLGKKQTPISIVFRNFSGSWSVINCPEGKHKLNVNVTRVENTNQITNQCILLASKWIEVDKIESYHSFIVPALLSKEVRCRCIKVLTIKNYLKSNYFRETLPPKCELNWIDIDWLILTSNSYFPWQKQNLCDQDADGGDAHQDVGENAQDGVISICPTRVVEHDSKVGQMLAETNGLGWMTVSLTQLTSGSWPGKVWVIPPNTFSILHWIL